MFSDGLVKNQHLDYISIVISRVFATQPLAAKVLTEEVPTETLEVAFVETITEAPGKLVEVGAFQEGL